MFRNGNNAAVVLISDPANGYDRAGRLAGRARHRLLAARDHGRRNPVDAHACARRLTSSITIREHGSGGPIGPPLDAFANAGAAPGIHAAIRGPRSVRGIRRLYRSTASPRSWKGGNPVTTARLEHRADLKNARSPSSKELRSLDRRRERRSSASRSPTPGWRGGRGSGRSSQRSRSRSTSTPPGNLWTTLRGASERAL